MDEFGWPQRRTRRGVPCVRSCVDLVLAPQSSRCQGACLRTTRHVSASLRGAPLRQPCGSLRFWCAPLPGPRRSPRGLGGSGCLRVPGLALWTGRGRVLRLSLAACCASSRCAELESFVYWLLIRFKLQICNGRTARALNKTPLRARAPIAPLPNEDRASACPQEAGQATMPCDLGSRCSLERNCNKKNSFCRRKKFTVAPHPPRLRRSSLPGASMHRWGLSFCGFPRLGTVIPLTPDLDRAEQTSPSRASDHMNHGSRASVCPAGKPE